MAASESSMPVNKRLEHALVKGIDEFIELAFHDEIELAPGKYEITLSNPSFKSPVKQVVDVSAGRDELVNVHFTDPATASLPSLLGGGR